MKTVETTLFRLEILEDLVKQVAGLDVAIAAIPQMMVGIADRQVRIEDRLGHLVHQAWLFAFAVMPLPIYWLTVGTSLDHVACG